MFYTIRTTDAVHVDPHHMVLTVGKHFIGARIVDEPYWDHVICALAQMQGIDPTDTLNGCLQAYNACQSALLKEVNCSGNDNGLAQYADEGRVVWIDDFYRWTEEVLARELEEARRRADKKRLSDQRRSFFNNRRAALQLALINAGHPYRCAIPGCAEGDLTIDHIVPLSRGGSDDLTNLRFLCRRHNCMKGDRT